jgi:hypothetical protein
LQFWIFKKYCFYVCVFLRSVFLTYRIFAREDFSTSNQGGLYCHHIRNCYTRWAKSKYTVIILYTINCIPTFGPHCTCMLYIHTKLQVTSHFLRVHSHQNEREIQNMYSDILTVYILQSTYLIKLLEIYFGGFKSHVRLLNWLSIQSFQLSSSWLWCFVIIIFYYMKLKQNFGQSLIY